MYKDITAHNWRIAQIVLLGIMGIWAMFAYSLPSLQTYEEEIAHQLKPFYILYGAFGFIVFGCGIYCCYRERKMRNIK